MGKAATELPDALDPTEASGKPAAVDVDELLAQMAGDEIDRLLSEADEPRPAQPRRAAPAEIPPPQAAPVARPKAAPPEAVEEEVARQLDEFFDAAAAPDIRAETESVQPLPPIAAPITQAPDQPLPPASTAPPPPSDDALTRQLDDLFAQLEGVDRAAATRPAPIAETPALPARPAVLPEPLPVEPSPPVDEPSATSTLERSALDAPLPAVDILTDEQDADDDSLPWYLKPLEWINAPLDALPDPLRELMGKLGLLTLFNALAVLVYVFIFRKHHH